MNPLLTEELISLANLAAKIKSHRRTGSISVQAVWRWATKGIRLGDGSVAKLGTVRLAGRYLTSWPSYLRFIEAQNSTSKAEFPIPSRPLTKRQRESERAAEELAAAGV